MVSPWSLAFTLVLHLGLYCRSGPAFASLDFAGILVACLGRQFRDGISFVFAIQGLAVVWFYLSRWNVRRWAAITVTVLLTLLTPLMVLVGLLDSWFDLRRLDLL